jgi:hypothetical protein
MSKKSANLETFRGKVSLIYKDLFNFLATYSKAFQYIESENDLVTINYFKIILFWFLSHNYWK